MLSNISMILSLFLISSWILELFLCIVLVCFCCWLRSMLGVSCGCAFWGSFIRILYLLVLLGILSEGKSYNFENTVTKFLINKDLSCNSKNVVYIIECSKCKEIYIASTQALNTRTSLHRSNIKITENRKLNVSKHLYECSQGEFKIMPVYQTNEYLLLQIKEKKFIDKFKPKLNKTWIINAHKRKQTYIDMYTHTYKKESQDIH